MLYLAFFHRILHWSVHNVFTNSSLPPGRCAANIQYLLHEARCG